MGNGQSLFYPDNGNRHDRAQQLANDCQGFKVQFEMKKAALERALGPYQAKINNVMQAFGCKDLDDLNDLVQTHANREALEKWNSVKSFYDKTQMYPCSLLIHTIDNRKLGSTRSCSVSWACEFDTTKLHIRFG